MKSAHLSLPSSLALALAAVAVMQVVPIFTTAAEAATVTACSRYGKGCVTAPVRRSPQGLEVRFPGGTWINCSGDCREKLREESLDFWDTHKPENSGGAGRQ